MGIRPDQKEILRSHRFHSVSWDAFRNQASAEADRQSCEIEGKVASPGPPGSIWYPSPTSRDRTQELGVAKGSQLWPFQQDSSNRRRLRRPLPTARTRWAPKTTPILSQPPTLTLRVPPHLRTAISRSPLPARTAQRSSRDPLPGPHWARHPHRK